jgi:CelD/BcsL family acetyltransferase involved in cellulose biosynthesis
MQKYRGAQRKAGEVRFEYRSNDSKQFDLLVEWKRKQYRATGVPDILAHGWTESLLHEILALQTAEFSGVLSTLYIDDLPAALLLSMRSGDVLHAWFTAYGPQFAEFSPGLLLWIELAKAADVEGFRRVDLGKGPEEYKRHFMSGEIALAEGSADLRPVAGMIHRAWDRTYRWLRNSPLKKPLLVPGRFVKRMLAKRDE